MPVKILPASGSGSATLISVAGTTTNDTLTLPARTGNIITSADTGTVTQAMIQNGNSSTPLPGIGATGPAFAAYGTALQSIANETYTKVNYNTEEFDTNNNYDPVNYRFLPTVAGYYQISAIVAFGPSATAGARGIIGTYLDGVIVRIVSANLNTANNTNLLTTSIVKVNGSSNYIEIFMYQNSGGSLNCGSSGPAVVFSGALVRAN